MTRTIEVRRQQGSCCTQEHNRKAGAVRYNGRCTELEEQHARLVQSKQYRRAHAVAHKLRGVRAEQEQQHAARQQRSWHAAQAHARRRHAQEARVLRQKHDDAAYKLLAAQHEDSQLRVRQRHAAVSGLARAQRQDAVSLEADLNEKLGAAVAEEVARDAEGDALSATALSKYMQVCSQEHGGDADDSSAADPAVVLVMQPVAPSRTGASRNLRSAQTQPAAAVHTRARPATAPRAATGALPATCSPYAAGVPASELLQRPRVCAASSRSRLYCHTAASAARAASAAPARARAAPEAPCLYTRRAGDGGAAATGLHVARPSRAAPSPAAPSLGARLRRCTPLGTSSSGNDSEPVPDAEVSIASVDPRRSCSPCASSIQEAPPRASSAHVPLGSRTARCAQPTASSRQYLQCTRRASDRSSPVPRVRPPAVRSIAPARLGAAPAEKQASAALRSVGADRHASMPATDASLTKAGLTTAGSEEHGEMRIKADWGAAACSARCGRIGHIASCTAA
jgi:hypothetical protein